MRRGISRTIGASSTMSNRTLNRPYRILGRCSQMIRCNWKLYAENSRDTYHPSLLHSFATMFKLNRLSAEGASRWMRQGLHTSRIRPGAITDNSQRRV